jgi:hypothetical protein
LLAPPGARASTTTVVGRRSAFMICATRSPAQPIVDLGLDVAQVSRIIGHARITITLGTCTHLFEDARPARDIRDRMAPSAFAKLLETAAGPTNGTVVSLR